jgi:hypothetical protein
LKLPTVLREYDNVGGFILFRDDSTAERATISEGSNLRFAGHSRLGAHYRGPSTTLSFNESADGGIARLFFDADSSLDIWGPRAYSGR